ncbi:myb-like protein D [Amyelois transitella]|uniref:myb-like protein D n=1 Tax=Amyelois transitella TaxID=680683 RepID=UPI00067BEDC7|nr:myb-like protein D [Amyelois transitella]
MTTENSGIVNIAYEDTTDDININLNNNDVANNRTDDYYDDESTRQRENEKMQVDDDENTKYIDVNVKIYKTTDAENDSEFVIENGQSEFNKRRLAVHDTETSNSVDGGNANNDNLTDNITNLRLGNDSLEINKTTVSDTNILSDDNDKYNVNSVKNDVIFTEINSDGYGHNMNVNVKRYNHVSNSLFNLNEVSPKSSLGGEKWRSFHEKRIDSPSVTEDNKFGDM